MDERNLTLLTDLYQLTMMNGYLHHESQLILSVVSNRELSRVERLVKEIDPECFMVVSKVSEVRGRGFSLSKQYQ